MVADVVIGTFPISPIHAIFNPFPQAPMESAQQSVPP